jgi:hypothetical protein
MGDYGADTLRDTLVAGWAPSNARIPKTATSGVEQIVHFLAHPQIDGAHEWPLAIEIAKIMDPQTPENENQTVHPRFTEVRHRFTITCRRRVQNITETLFDQAHEDIEDMCIETVRILKTVYNPLAGTGAFFTAKYNWSNQDKLQKIKQEIVRVLDFELTEIQSQSTEVFRGYGGVLTFDLSASANMDTAPSGDYIYTEAYDVKIREGTTVVEALGKDTVNGARVPRLGSGIFTGTFTANIYAKKSDIGSTDEKLDKIYLLQANGQHIEAGFLHAVTSTESTPSTLSQTSFVKVTSMMKITSDEALVGFNVEGRLIKPSAFVVA